MRPRHQDDSYEQERAVTTTQNPAIGKSAEANGIRTNYLEAGEGYGRGDNDVVKYLVVQGAQLDVRSKRGQTITDMANGPMVNAHLPMEHPDTIALLEKLGAPAPEVPVAGAPKLTRKDPR